MKSTKPSNTEAPLTNGSLPLEHNISRRRFIRAASVAAAGAAFTGVGAPAGAARRNKALPAPNKSGIKHIVVVMMENRSFDHFLGWVPGADGRQQGLTYYDEAGVAHSTYHLAPDYQGCGHPDPDHSYLGGRVEYNNGACDGWLRAGSNDEYAIGYYTQADLAFYANAAQNFTTLDRYFSAIMAGTFPNKIYQFAAQTDRLENAFHLCALPTIWDRLAEHSLRARYYFSDIPFVALWGAKYLPISRHVLEFFADAAAGTLPQVSFIDPRFLGEGQGLSGDDHPYADIRNGQVFLNQIYEAVTSSPNWPNTVLVINYDEWGGFFDHVAPTRAPIPPADAALGSDGLRGFRTPAMVISPWSPRGTVAHGLYDHTSVLKMIEWRWNIRPLTVRDSTANNLAEALNFARPNYNAPEFPVPSGFFGGPCPVLSPPKSLERIIALAEQFGFPLP
jgi:phospholipase C